MDWDLLIEVLVMTAGVVVAFPSGYRLYELWRDRPHAGWSRVSAEVLEVSPSTPPLGAGQEQLTTRVRYRFITPAGPPEGAAHLPAQRAAAVGGRLDVVTHPTDPGRSTTDLPRPERRRRIVSATGGLLVGGALIGYASAAFAGIVPVDAHVYVVGRGAMLAIAGVVAGAGWFVSRRSAPDRTDWVTHLATIEGVGRRRDGDRWPVFVEYEGPDGVTRRGTAHRAGDKPAPGLKARLQIDRADPGHFRFP